MIQSIFIINREEDILIEKHYRGLINRNVCDIFLEEFRKAPRADEVLPVIATPKYFLMHIHRAGLFFVAVVNTEASPLVVFEFLHRICDVLDLYFENRLSEHQIRENFVTVYQLMDEMMDNGIPFTTEPNSLMEMIPPSGKIQKWVGSVTGGSNMSGVLPDGSLSNTPWRKTGVKYANNEIYFDIIEEIDAIIDSNGLPISMEIHGEIQVNCKLSGMPDLTLTFTNPGMMDDVSFHPCVRYNRWEQNKVISFVPPDGAFKLMNFRIKGQLQLPLYVKPTINLTQSGRVSVMVGPKNTQGKTVEEVQVYIPFPKTVSTAALSSNFGYIHYDDITKLAKWFVGRLPANKTPLLEGNVSFGATNSSSGSVSSPSMGTKDVEHANPTLGVEFKVTMLSVAGIKVDALSLHNEKYKPFKGVRNITKSGKFYVRC